MADHYVKLWASILDSSVWREPAAHRLVWIAMLTMADKNGFVGASVDGLARRANVSEAEVESALASFLAPDPRSRNQDNEGRRIQVVPRGWHILNHGYFRDLQDREAQRVYERTRKAEQRARQSLSRGVPDTKGHVPDSPGQTRVCPLPSSDTDADADADADSPSASAAVATKKVRRRSNGDLPAGFAEFWEAYDYKKKQPDAIKAWLRIDPDEELRAKIIRQASATRAANPEREFYAYPATWLNGECWNDEIVPRVRPGGWQRGEPLAVPRRIPKDYYKDGNPNDPTDWGIR